MPARRLHPAQVPPLVILAGLGAWGALGCGELAMAPFFVPMYVSATANAIIAADDDKLPRPAEASACQLSATLSLVSVELSDVVSREALRAGNLHGPTERLAAFTVRVEIENTGSHTVRFSKVAATNLRVRSDDPGVAPHNWGAGSVESTFMAYGSMTRPEFLTLEPGQRAELEAKQDMFVEGMTRVWLRARYEIPSMGGVGIPVKCEMLVVDVPRPPQAPDTPPASDAPSGSS